MVKVREVYNYTSSGGIFDNKIPLAASSASIGTTLTNTAEIRNHTLALYDSKKTAVGKGIFNISNNIFEREEIALALFL